MSYEMNPTAEAELVAVEMEHTEATYAEVVEALGHAQASVRAVSAEVRNLKSILASVLSEPVTVPDALASVNEIRAAEGFAPRPANNPFQSDAA